MTAFPSLRFARPRLQILGCALGVLLAAACASSEYTYSTNIAGGERRSFRMINGRVQPEQEDGLATLTPQMLPNLKEKTVRFMFGLRAQGAPALKHVRVEDVSDDKPVLLFEDAAPKLKDGIWVGGSKWYTTDSPELHWLSYLDNSFRVYRFTVTLADGRTVVLHQGEMYADFAKAMMRNALGIKT